VTWAMHAQVRQVYDPTELECMPMGPRGNSPIHTHIDLSASELAIAC
jgi:hypothetical protein